MRQDGKGQGRVKPKLTHVQRADLQGCEADPEIGMVLNAVNPADPYFLPISPNWRGDQALRSRSQDIDSARQQGEAQRLFRLNPFVAQRTWKIEAKIAGKPYRLKKSASSRACQARKFGTSG